MGMERRSEEQGINYKLHGATTHTAKSVSSPPSELQIREKEKEPEKKGTEINRYKLRKRERGKNEEKRK
jgi:hypothetical protein